MNARARRARKVVRDRRRHYDGSPALCPDTCVICAQRDRRYAPFPYGAAVNFFDILDTVAAVQRLVSHPDAPRLIREATDEMRHTIAAARGETTPLAGPIVPGAMKSMFALINGSSSTSSGWDEATYGPEFCECGGPYNHLTPCDPGEDDA